MAPATAAPFPADHAHYRAAYRGAAAAILVHVLVLYAAFTVLAVVFQFPDVLRGPAAERLDLFLRTATLVRPTYWVLALTGFTQIAMAVLLFQSFPERGRTLPLFGLVFGVLAGILQTIGFIRWAILVPYLARAMGDPTVPDVTRQAIALVEGSFNRYAGMAIGEHTANLCLCLWTLCVALVMRRTPLFDRRLGIAGLILAPVAFVLALEQLDVGGGLLARVVDVGFPAWIVWLVVTATSLLRTDPASGAGPPLTWRTATWAGVLYVVLAVPMLAG